MQRSERDALLAAIYRRGRQLRQRRIALMIGAGFAVLVALVVPVAALA